MVDKNKRMSLFGGLLAEGLDASLRTFQQMTREEQINLIQSGVRTLEEKLYEVNRSMEQLKNKKIREAWFLIWEDYFELIRNIPKKALENPIDAFLDLVFSPFTMMFKIHETIWGTFYGWLLDMFWPQGPVSFKEAQSNAMEFFTIAGDFNVLASVFDIIGHTKILGTKLPGEAVAFFIRNISWTFGLGWLTWIVMGPVLRHSIADPYDKTVRKITRPADFTISQIEDFYEHGIAQLEEFMTRLVELGYSDDKILMLYELIKKRVLREEARRYATDVANAFVKGYVTPETLWQAITLAYWTDDERKFRMMEENIRKTIEIVDVRVKEIERAFKNQKIDESEATARLSSYIVDPQMIEAYIALWKQYIKPEEEVEPDETKELRKKRLELKIEGLKNQIDYLEKIKQERIEVYDAMIDEIKVRLEAKIASAKEEFVAWQEKTVTEIEARLIDLSYQYEKAESIDKERILAKMQMLEAIKEVRIAEREAKLNALIERWKKEATAKIKTIEQKKEVEMLRLDSRIDKLKFRLDEYELELTALQKVS